MAIAGDDIEDAVGQTRLAEDLLELERGQRRFLGGLEDGAAAGGEGRCDFEHRDEEGPVPGDDQADHADRLELSEVVVVVVPAEQSVGNHTAGLAVDLADPAGVIMQDAVGHRDDVFGGRGVHAVVAGFELGEFLGAFLDDGVSAEQHVRAVRGGRLAPDAGLKCFACPGHRVVDGRLVGIDDLRDLLLGGRVENRNGRGITHSA